MSYDNTTTDLCRAITASMPFDGYAIAVRGEQGIAVAMLPEATTSEAALAIIGRQPDGRLRSYAAGLRMREVESGEGADHQRYSLGVAGSQRWFFVTSGRGTLLREMQAENAQDDVVLAGVFLDLV